ncbi:NUDIX hydrolase [Plantactinospora soyae]|uniref:ADP-ribose pyrophosphatase YjhB (NUDIX family) n=1 Tax=Plantactinospora soyae TaxID=1544732 RepID=A0A927R5W6_9ACTN|nr:NUDIX domain-containing protein [Plantactinospora soyae]MBE1486301.1 ADP-ribose pyrophosphatase YjhB (NUDIX family) [Plantactinospora soyae]
MKVIDKLAWVHVTDGKVLSTRSYGKDAWYIPGGKRDEGETDHEALKREIREELCVELIDGSIEPMEVFEAQAHGKAEGVIVRMTCYRAEYKGELTPGAEIEEMSWLDYSGREMSSTVDKLIFDWLRKRGEL